MIKSTARQAILTAAGAMTFRHLQTRDGKAFLVAELDAARGDLDPAAHDAFLALRELHKLSAPVLREAGLGDLQARAWAAHDTLEQALRQARGEPSDPSVTMLVRNYRRALADRLLEITEADGGKFLEYSAAIDD